MEFKSDPAAIIFNLNTLSSFPCKNPSEAIGCLDKTGPRFGIGLDLSATYPPFNEENHCHSKAY